jgi:PAS domain-containing protein
MQACSSVIRFHANIRARPAGIKIPAQRDWLGAGHPGRGASEPIMRPSDSPEQDAAAAAEHTQAEFAHSALENLFEVSPNAIFVTDAQGVIRAANPRATELFGYSHEELIAMPVESLVPHGFARGIPVTGRTTTRTHAPGRWARP